MVTFKSEWVTAAEAARLIGLPDSRAVRRLVSRGLIGERRLPVRARFKRGDVLRVAAESVHPAEQKAS